MSISIQTNVTSLIAQQNLSVNNDFQSKTIQALTSGYRINQSGDDAAGLAVANQFRSSIAELTQGVRNANDGVSALQIVDGGLNNISQMLDRLKTLATQSASTTFTGDRGTLNTEYQQLLGEVTQQAANVGLVNGGKYNVVNNVYVGGGNTTANSQVTIDLSGTQNQVDAAGLGIANSSVGSGGTELTGNQVRLDAPGATFLANAASQTFTFDLISNNNEKSVVATVTGGAGATGGLTSTQVLSSLNSQLSQYGINASLASDGQLQFGGSTAFTVATASGAPDLIATTATKATNTGVFSAAGAGAYTAVNETLTFQNGSGTATVTLLAASDTLASAIGKINAAGSSIGIYAVKNTTGAGTGISIQSANSFTASTTAATGTFTLTGAQTVTPPTTTGSLIGNALASVTSINAALSFLGLVQGRVGTGQNKLQYATQLAQSQISSFSAAQSRIRDADIAAEAANLTKAQVLQQASIAAMSQANAAPQQVLALLK